MTTTQPTTTSSGSSGIATDANGNPVTNPSTQLDENSFLKLLVARDDSAAIVGSLTLVLFRIPTAVRAWIEDVVVDESARGRGVASALVNRALEQAAVAGARTVDLTSRPSRQDANRLYQELGFELRETNVYRYALD